MKYNGQVLAALIRKRRLCLNYSQEYIAGKLGMSQNAYSKLELGHTNITLGKFIVICETLTIDLQEMLTLYGDHLE